MTFYEKLTQFGLPIEFGKITNEKTVPPFLVYLSNAPEVFDADNKRYNVQKKYNLEYYFEKKDEEKEEALDKFLEEANYTFNKSGDVYIDSENLFVIYYEVWI